MTTASGSFAYCENGDFAYHFVCSGPNCYALNNFPNATCTNSSTNVLTCTTNVVCENNSKKFVNQFTFGQVPGLSLVASQQNFTVLNQSWIAQTDGKSNITATNTTGANPPALSKKSVAGRTAKSALANFLVSSALFIMIISLLPRAVATQLEFPSRSTTLAKELIPRDIPVAFKNHENLVLPKLPPDLMKFLESATANFLGGPHLTDCVKNRELTAQLEDAVCQTILPLGFRGWEAMTTACSEILIGLVIVQPEVSFAVAVWGSLTCNMIASFLASQVTNEINAICDFILQHHDPPGKQSWCPSSGDHILLPPTTTTSTSSSTASPTSRPGSGTNSGNFSWDAITGHCPSNLIKFHLLDDWYIGYYDHAGGFEDDFTVDKIIPYVCSDTIRPQDPDSCDLACKNPCQLVPGAAKWYLSDGYDPDDFSWNKLLNCTVTGDIQNGRCNGKSPYCPDEDGICYGVTNGPPRSDGACYWF